MFGAPARAQWNGNSEVARLEKYMADLVNADRIRHGKPPIKVNSKLSALARSYAEEMARTGKFAHVDKQGLNPQQRARRAGIECGVYENLGWQKGSRSPIEMLDAVERSMMNEPENQKNHRYNILHENHYCMGIGVAIKKNQLYAVQEFADDEPAGSESVFPNQLGGNVQNGNFAADGGQPGSSPGAPAGSFDGRFFRPRLVVPQASGPVLGPSGDPTARDADDGIPQESSGGSPASVAQPAEARQAQDAGFGPAGIGGFDGNADRGASSGAGAQAASGGAAEGSASVIEPEDSSRESFETRRKQFLQSDRLKDMRDEEIHNDLED